MLNSIFYLVDSNLENVISLLLGLIFLLPLGSSRPRDLKPRDRPKGKSAGEELPLLPFGNPIGIVPAASRGVTQ